MNASLNGTAAVFTQIFKNTTMISAAYSVNSAGYYANNSVAFQGNTGDTFYVTIASGTTTSNLVSVLATADNNATASPTQQVSSDTMSFAFKATAIDPAVDAIGTFNTYTYGAANSTAIATSAPTQTSSSMNINGIFVTARAYGGTLGSTTPARFDIFIGKGLKSKQVDAYINAAKSGSMSVDHLTTATLETGSFIQYNETTGILVIDAGWCVLGGVSRTIGSDVLTQALVPSGYFVFNASKSPSLVTVPNLQQRIAYLSDVKASGTASGSAGAATTQTRTLNTIVDSTGIVTSLASNQFTLSKGVYNIEASAPAFATNNNRTRIRNITDSTTALLGTSEYATSSSTSGSRSFVTGEISITSAKVFELQHYTVTAAASNGLGVQTGSGESEVYATVKITKIKDI